MATTHFRTAKETAESLRGLPQVKRWRDGNHEPGDWFSSPPSDEGGF